MDKSMYIDAGAPKIFTQGLKPFIVLHIPFLQKFMSFLKRINNLNLKLT